MYIVYNFYSTKLSKFYELLWKNFHFSLTNIKYNDIIYSIFLEFL